MCPRRASSRPTTSPTRASPLADRGLYGVEVAEKPSIWKTEITKKKVPRSELMNFSRQLGAFVRAGIPIIDAIETLRERDPQRPVPRRAGRRVGVAAGGRARSPKRSPTHPEAFPSFYVTILRSAELTGHVDDVLEQLADYIERDENARRKIKQALTYPLVVIAFALVAVVVLVAYALPRFQTFFDSLDAKLPLVTRILIGITDFITTTGDGCSRWSRSWSSSSSGSGRRAPTAVVTPRTAS